MLSFRKKILLSDLILFLTFIALLFPFVGRTVGNIMRRSLESQAERLIARLKTSASLEEMVDALESEEIFTSQRVTLFALESNKGYENRSPKNSSERKIDLADYAERHPEIAQALASGKGYSEFYSEGFKETFAYIAILFEFQGGKFILRTGFPFHQVREFTRYFEVGFLILGSFVLLLYSIMTWAIIHRLSRPIQNIIDAILPYQEGKVEFLPKIAVVKDDEFSKLAHTLNSLSERIQTQIESLMQQREETAGILESLSEGVIALDSHTKVTFANGVACKMLSVRHSEIIHQKLDLIRSKEKDLVKKSEELVIKVLKSLEPSVQTWTSGEGRKIFLDLIGAPLTKQNGAILVLQDKTSDYRIVEMGKDFIANASHELRTPITIIRGFAETLEDLPDLSQEVRSEITGKIVKTCGRLDKLVKSLLTLADIENLSQKELLPADLLTIAASCTQTLLAIHPHVDISLNTSLSKAPVNADSDLLELALMNLLENAVKYSQKEVKIELSILSEPAHFSLAVKDRGLGIPEADLPHIFERFYTVDKARSRKSGGTGLGLSIVKTVIEKHKGSVKVFSELDKGSEFILSIPKIVYLPN